VSLKPHGVTVESDIHIRAYTKRGAQLIRN
jgi:hypothetical protein